MAFKYKGLIALLFSITLFSFSRVVKPKLIGHRGGVIDSTNAENSLQALKDAYKKGYYMVEIDVRLSSDRQLVTNHDNHFSKYFNNPAKVADLSWDNMRVLRNNKDDGHPLLFEEVLQYCKGKMQIMIDNKIMGNDTASFHHIKTLLNKYGLLSKAMFIGTEETRAYFYGAAACGYSRADLEKQMNKPRFDPSKVFLFDHGNVLVEDDIRWADQHKITVVPSINKFHYTAEPFMDGARRDIGNLRKWGVEYFQIDSEYDIFLH
ncbi:MAG TPA: glycerophosphodiester phosphodiesterase family protein [Chitinophagaceae bacterium]|nr:glycerophosphodiester phosphodiesterase family protein [Chitinophagaceae bacterium]